MEIRWKYLTKPTADSYTVLVERIPENLRSKEALSAYFSEIIGSKQNVISVQLIDEDLDTSVLESAVFLRTKVCEALEKAKATGCNGDSNPNWSSVPLAHASMAYSILKDSGVAAPFLAKPPCRRFCAAAAGIVLLVEA